MVEDIVSILPVALIALLLLIFSNMIYGFGAGIIFLAVAISLLLQVGMPQSGWQILLLSLALALSIPLSAYLAGALLDKFCFEASNDRSFKVLLLALALAMSLQISPLLGFVDSLIAILNSGSGYKLTLFLTSLASSVLFCGGLIAFCVMTLALAFELGARWILGATAWRMEVSFQALRSLVVIVLLCLAFNSGLGLVLSELKPTRIFDRFVSN